MAQIIFSFTNFYNPWSAVTIESISVKSYANSDCQDPAAASVPVDKKEFYAVAIPTSAVSVTSTGTEIGDSSPENTATFKFTPTTTLSKDGRGSIDISIPEWYTQRGSSSMMFQQNPASDCVSDQMTITRSEPSLRFQNIIIDYKDMKEEAISGQ